MLLRVPPFDVANVVAAERNRPILVAVGTEERTEQPTPFRRGVEAIRVVEDMARLVAHVHHHLAIRLERIDSLFELPELGIGEIKRDAEHGLLIGTAPLVGQVTDGPEFLEPATLELEVQLTDVALDRRALDPQAELADLHSEHAADFRVERLELHHSSMLLGVRSEEHTSELQSQSNLVCRLL